MINLTNALHGLRLKSIAATTGPRRLGTRTRAHERNRNYHRVAGRIVAPAKRQLQ